MSTSATVWIWTRNTLLGELLAEAVQIRGLTVRHHNHPYAPPPEEAKVRSLLVVGPCIGDAEVFLWWQMAPPVLVLLRELAVGEPAGSGSQLGRIRLALPLDLGEFHRCLEAHAVHPADG
jgi:hypothetical protein